MVPDKSEAGQGFHELVREKSLVGMDDSVSSFRWKLA
jgi:hypothetical protein